MAMSEDYRAERNRYWSAIRDMRQEYMEEFKGIYDLTNRPTVHYWAEEKYGFRMEVDGEGGYTAKYDVIDDKKFMLFQIKYWK
jgi:hypothetical protein